MTQPELTILNHYLLKAGAAEFSAAIQALALRVEREGEQGVQSYRFYVNETSGCARAVIDYATPQAWVGHHEVSMAWPEMQALHHAARLTEVTFLGAMTEDIRQWLASSGLTAQVDSGYTAAAAFCRSTV